MVNNETLSVEGGAIEWLRTANPTVTGACHDSVNTVYPLISPPELSGERVSIEIDNTLEDSDLAFANVLAEVAQFLVADTGKILELERGLLIRLFNTPHHRLWCANYDEDSRPQFDADWAAVMLVVQPDLPFADLQQQARAAVKAVFS